MDILSVQDVYAYQSTRTLPHRPDANVAFVLFIGGKLQSVSSVLWCLNLALANV